MESIAFIWGRYMVYWSTAIVTMACAVGMLLFLFLYLFLDLCLVQLLELLLNIHSDLLLNLVLFFQNRFLHLYSLRLLFFHFHLL